MTEKHVFLDKNIISKKVQPFILQYLIKLPFIIIYNLTIFLKQLS